jgi:hypothetical protein
MQWLWLWLTFFLHQISIKSFRAGLEMQRSGMLTLTLHGMSHETKPNLGKEFVIYPTPAQDLSTLLAVVAT